MNPEVQQFLSNKTWWVNITPEIKISEFLVSVLNVLQSEGGTKEIKQI